jgi:hypothetical protein
MKNGYESVAKAPASMSAEPYLQPKDCDYFTMDRGNEDAASAPAAAEG